MNLRLFAAMIAVVIPVTVARGVDLAAQVSRLGSSDPAARDDAENALVDAGSRSIPALRPALSDPVPEVAVRARRALRWVQLFRRRGLSDETFQRIDAYRRTVSAYDRSQTIQALAMTVPRPDAAVSRLITLEPNPLLRSQLLQIVGDHYIDEFSRIYVDDDDPQAARELLAVGVETGSRDAAANYAAFVHLTGAGADLIAQLRTEMGNGSDDAKHRSAALLFFLYRVAGDRVDAAAMAAQSGDPQLVTLLLNDAGDWEALCKLPDNRFEDPLRSAGLNAVYQRLAGHKDAEKAEMAEFVDMPAGLAPGRLLLLTDRPADGLEQLVGSQPLAEFRVRVDRGEIDPAIGLARNSDPRSADAPALLEALKSLRLELVGGSEPVPTTRPVAPTTELDRQWAAGLDALKKGRYRPAAAAFAAVWNDQTKPPAALYLQGCALARAGDAAEGDRLMKLAEIVPAGDPLARWKFARALQDANLNELADRQFELALRTGGQFDDIGFSEIFNDRMRTAAAESRWSDAADAADRLCVVAASMQVLWRDPIRYFQVPAEARLLRARADRAKNDWPAATAAFDDFLAYCPIDVEAGIEWVTALDAAGRHDAADQTFAAMTAPMEAILTEYPRYAMIHNQIAWMDACCNRRLDAALDHATRAAALRRNNWQSLDTLAEVQFRRGDRAAAVGTETKAAAANPGDPYLSRQLARYRAAPVPSTTQPVAEPT